MTASTPHSPWLPRLVLAPGFALGLAFIYGLMAWNGYLPFSASRLLPNYEWAGLVHYQTLWASERWWLALRNLAVFGDGHRGSRAQRSRPLDLHDRGERHLLLRVAPLGDLFYDRGQRAPPSLSLAAPAMAQANSSKLSKLWPERKTSTCGSAAAMPLASGR